MGAKYGAATSLRSCCVVLGDQDGWGTNRLSKAESILGTGMSQNLSRGRRHACEYIYLFLSRFNIGPFITGAVQPKLNQGNLKLIPIISPDDKIMELFNETISIVFKKIICLQKECKTLQGLRDTLLPQLISGKIRVNQPEDAAA